MAEKKDRIALLTSGGIAPCLSASIGSLIKEYSELVPDLEIIGYLNGYKGLLIGNRIIISDEVRKHADLLCKYGGSVIGNSRVKLTNVADCVKKGYIQEGENPLQVAAEQLIKDNVSILHTIGGDDTNIMASQLSSYLEMNGYELTVVGLPKTVDNDVIPIHQTLGAVTAAEQGAIFFENVANENTTSSRQLLIHEVMGRHCGWLTAATAREYRKRLEKKKFLPDILLARERWDIDAIYIPEMNIDIDEEEERLNRLMDEKDSVTVFLSEGAGTETIVAEMEAKGETVYRDAFGHVRLDELNPGLWFARRFKTMLKADKVLVQKSGYFARSAPPNKEDLDLIKRTCKMSAQCGLNGESGVVALDEEHNNELRCIDFSRIKRGRAFDTQQKWFQDMLIDIGQIR
ncbi:MAG TPA: pyrophosphate--fructose-6-phosphate 1-phosphotransferase [Candidatus Cloacimonetes bacterium]|nr:pyrophosphate--fructose-6-phosphate 1-phosphotransferase [Candidatus Cloacimonadota bacterium]HEX37576.1 pyrophosphate--fructose-6-phosphate 1-phosphotransferase [Candidatus Cloacimonadota bacterium]